MFVDRRQQANAKYGRDQCLACHRLLGLGYGASSKIFGCTKSTIARIGLSRVPVPRYEGFDAAWQLNRGRRVADMLASTRPAKDDSLKRAFQVYYAEWMKDIRNACQLEAVYETAYRRKYRHWREGDRVRKQMERKRFRDKHPDRYDANRARERELMYLRRGVPLDQIPAKMAAPMSRADIDDLTKIRKKREYLRRKVRDVWKGLLSDPAALRIVGCSVQEFQNHIRSKLIWKWDEDDYGLLWNFDHVKPLAAFDVLDPVQCREANHWANIRPCCWRENSVKGARWEEPELLEIRHQGVRGS